MRHIVLILNVLGLIGILAGGAIVMQAGSFAHQPIGMVLITGSLG